VLVIRFSLTNCINFPSVDQSPSIILKFLPGRSFSSSFLYAGRYPSSLCAVVLWYSTLISTVLRKIHPFSPPVKKEFKIVKCRIAGKITAFVS
jgi:hypothetical protein